MNTDISIQSNFSKEESLERIREYLKSFGEENLTLSNTDDTYFIQKSRGKRLGKTNVLHFFMLQFTMTEHQDGVKIILSTQTKMISILMKVLFIPLIWLCILLVGFDGKLTLVNNLLIASLGFIGTFLLIVIQKKSTNLETKIVKGLQETFLTP